MSCTPRRIIHHASNTHGRPQAQENSANLTVKSAIATCVLLYLCMLASTPVQTTNMGLGISQADTPSLPLAPFAVEYVKKLV